MSRNRSPSVQRDQATSFSVLVARATPSLDRDIFDIDEYSIRYVDGLVRYSEDLEQLVRIVVKEAVKPGAATGAWRDSVFARLDALRPE